jgi:beta-glucosidase-like glycosyl hydrolase
VDSAKTAGILAAPEHRALALDLARKSIVLLKNEKKLLPLRPNFKSILVTDPTPTITPSWATGPRPSRGRTWLRSWKESRPGFRHRPR